MPKVYVSPSDQYANTYAAGGTNEDAQCEKIAVALVEALKRCGFEAKTNLTESMAERMAESNAWADLHLAIHTNAYNGKVAGTRIYVYEFGTESHKAAQAIFAVLAPFTPGTSENIKAKGNSLYELRKAKKLSVYVEVDFHDVAAVAEWIIANTTAIAEKICEGVCDYYNIAYVGGEDVKRYQTFEELPDWAKPETKELIDAGALKGNEKGLDLTEDMLRCLLISKRYAAKLSKN